MKLEETMSGPQCLKTKCHRAFRAESLAQHLPHFDQHRLSLNIRIGDYGAARSWMKRSAKAKVVCRVADMAIAAVTRFQTLVNSLYDANQ